MMMALFSQVANLLGGSVVFLVTPFLVLMVVMLVLSPKEMLKILMEDDTGLSRRARRKQKKAPLTLTPRKRRWVRIAALFAGVVMLWWAGMVVELLSLKLNFRHVRRHFHNESALVHLLLLYLAAPILFLSSVLLPFRIWQATRVKPMEGEPEPL
jgi:polyferredoxin